MDAVLQFTATRVLSLVAEPTTALLICAGYIASYYIVSALCLNAARHPERASCWKQNGFLDRLTSVLWTAFAVLLISGLVLLAGRGEVELFHLVIFYVFFIFLFAFVYDLIGWHHPGVLDGVESLASWKAEGQLLVMSVQTQTCLGYTRARPNALVTEFFAGAQALLGLLFCIIFIAKAVSLLA